MPKRRHTTTDFSRQGRFRGNWHFDKHFVKNIRKKDPTNRATFWNFFSLDTIKTRS